MKKFAILVVGCLALIQTFLAQAAPAHLTDSESDELLGVIKKLQLAKTSLAYRSTAVQHMLQEANYFSVQLNLPTPHPIQIRDIDDIHVTPLWYSKIENTNLASAVERVLHAKFVVGGFIETTNFCFFFQGGRLWSVVNRVQHMERFDLYPVWAKTASLISSNGAVQLATQWLASVDIEVGALEKKHIPKVEQQWFWNQPGLNVHHPPGDTNKTVLPIFSVTWGGDAVQVKILGTTNELMELRVGDSTFSHRPLLIITNAIELNNIPDPPLKHLERSPASETTSGRSPR
jgi:hypothetical protein